MQFFNILYATFQTLKRTRALWLAIAAPLFVVILRFFALFFNSEPENGKYFWDAYMEANYSFWFGIVMLLALALNIALLVDIDTSSHNWKYLFALPTSRTKFYIARLTNAVTITLISGLILYCASYLAGYLLLLLKPQIGLQNSSPDAIYYLGIFLLETLASTFMLSIYLWISMRTRSFVLPCSIGIVGAVVNLIAYENVTIQHFSPWMFALDINRVISKAPQTQPYLGWSWPIIITISIVGTITFTVLGARELTRRDIY